MLKCLSTIILQLTLALFIQSLQISILRITKSKVFLKQLNYVSKQIQQFQVSNLVFRKSFTKGLQNLKELRDQCWKELCFQPNQVKNPVKFYDLTEYIIAEFGISIQKDEKDLAHTNYVRVVRTVQHRVDEAEGQGEAVLKFQFEEEPQYQMREYGILEKLHSEYTSHLFYYFRFKGITVLALKRHDMTLTQIQNNLSSLTTTGQDDQLAKVYLHLFTIILKSVQYLHERQVIHRDLKPDNIMFDFPTPPTALQDYLTAKCILIDFDRSKCIGDELISEYVGTLKYIPPEGRQVQYTFSYDIYQLGIIYLLTIYRYADKNKNKYHHCPLAEFEFNSMIHEISSSQLRFKVNENVIKIIKSMICHNSLNRPTIKQILRQLQTA